MAALRPLARASTSAPSVFTSLTLRAAALAFPSPSAGSTSTPTLLGRLAAPLAALPGIQSLLELMPPILLAVPKHKVSHSRKSMRSATKGLKNKTNFTHCEACGTLKLAHNLCPTCVSQISRRWKKEARVVPKE